MVLQSKTYTVIHDKSFNTWLSYNYHEHIALVQSFISRYFYELDRENLQYKVKWTLEDLEYELFYHIYKNSSN